MEHGPTMPEPTVAPRRTIAVFGASMSAPGDGYYDEGVRCGALLARAGFAVATGGYGGTMEAVSKGAREAGGQVIGVTAPGVFPDRARPNEHVTAETRSRSLIERIDELTGSTDGAIVLWGSLGTAAELLVAWNLAYVAPHSGLVPKPVVVVGDPWASLVPHLEETLGVEPGLVTIVGDVEHAVSAIEQHFGSQG
jgi:uncharacterized protein (TIGR00725 family)